VLYLVYIDPDSGRRSEDAIHDQQVRGHQWCRYWTGPMILIDSDDKIEDVSKQVEQRMTPKDRFLVLEVGNAFSGKLPKEAWDWIQGVKGKK